jgi:hypothetical protein
MPLDVRPSVQVSPANLGASFHSPSSINGVTDTGFAGAGECSIWGPAFAGAIALYLVPPLIGGFLSGAKEGAKDAWADRKHFRRRRK